MRAALIQLNCSDDPAANLSVTEKLVREAAQQGADFILTPECTNLISLSRSHQDAVLTVEEDDLTLVRLREVTALTGVPLLIGSLCLRAGPGSERFVNRSFLIGGDGAIRARYDKIHMFDVDLPDGGAFRESARYRSGRKAVLCDAGEARVGMTICYDLRFPHLYRTLAREGAAILTIPSAFTVPTGEAHWHVLLRARAIENGCFVLAPAQTGHHAASRGKSRETFGHSLAVDPWGGVIADAGTEANTVTIVELDPQAVTQARAKIPALDHDRPYRLGDVI